MNIEVGSCVLVTTDNWFYGPDGRQYRGVFGTVRGVYSDQETLGIKTNARSTNWYAEIGNVTIAGCQVHYVIRCNTPPPATLNDYEVKDGVVTFFDRPACIYNADEPA